MTDPKRSGELAEYLRPTRYIDSDHSSVIDYVRSIVGGGLTERAKARALFYSVRDGIRYDAYDIDLRPEALRASATLASGFGFCIPKAVLLAAAARVTGIPSRLGFADVRNHLNTERLRDLMQTDVFAFHGYTELFLQGGWVKATPAFNASLCERFNVSPLDFTGECHALMQQCDRAGNRYMEYLTDHGQFADLPYDLMINTFEKHYPHLMANREGYGLEGEFEEDGREQPR